MTLFRDADFRGISQVFLDDVERLERQMIGDDTVSSVRVAPGCRVTLYSQENFRGTSLTLENDATNLGRSALGNDSVSSLRVDCRRYRPGQRHPGQYGGGAGGGRPGWYDEDRHGDRVGHGQHDGGHHGREERRGVALYQDSEFRGKSEVFYDEDPDLRDNPIGNDRASSIEVDPGCRAYLYPDTQFRGEPTIVDDDVAELGRTRAGNDRVSSIEVECARGDYGVVLFEHSGFRGRGELFRDDDPQLEDNDIRRDEASSVRVPPGCIATLYEHPYYEGRSVTLREDVYDLGRTQVGNDRVSSLRVECRRLGRRR